MIYLAPAAFLFATLAVAACQDMNNKQTKTAVQSKAGHTPVEGETLDQGEIGYTGKTTMIED